MHTTTTPLPRWPPACAPTASSAALVEPGDADYDAARAGWNGAIDRHPAAVAYATDADDVAAAIRAARAAGLDFTCAAAGTRCPGARSATARCASTCGR